jgi:hypothetical protein
VFHILLGIFCKPFGMFSIDSLDLYFSISIKNYFLSSKVSYVKYVSHDYYEIMKFINHMNFVELNSHTYHLYL